MPTSLTTSTNKWSASARVFHWVSALLLLITWLMIFLHENLADISLIDFHKAFGVSVLFWMLARVINRFFTKSPAGLPQPKWQTLLAHLTHGMLYLLLIAMPTVGVLMSWYSGRSIDMFGLFSLTPMVALDRAQARFYNELHTDIIWPMLLIFTALHIVAALYHQFINKDNAIARMK